MARIKQTIMQRSFTYMEIREDFLEGDDLDLRKESLRAARNMRGLASRAAEARPGTFMVRTLEGAAKVLEIKPASGVRFGLIINDTSLQVIDGTGAVVHEEASVPWTDGSEVWVNPFREKTVMGTGTDGIHVLEYDDGDWSFYPFEFLAGVGGEIAQPYWAYETDVTIKPSAETGDITITASGTLWKKKHVGLRIRYGQREIELTRRVSKTIMEGTVINRLPPSFEITVEDTTVFRVGEAIFGADTNYQGLIVGIDGSKLIAVTQSFFEGPDVGEEISGPAGSSKCTASAVVEPQHSPVWDEPLMSDLRGYPRSSGKVSGRMVLIDFPNVPDLIVLSSARDIGDFTPGADDDDAIVRQVGDGAPRWLHAINMGDLLLFSDNGVYNVPARENGVISPNTFNPVIVDEIGCSEISPVRVDDGIVFVDGSGKGVAAVFLDGNIYLKWSVRNLTTYHNHLVKTPVSLCGPSIGGNASEKYMFVVNSDGTIASVSWRENLRDEAVGFAPWDTHGQFVAAAPMFGEYWAIVDRQVDGSTVRFLERFDDDAYLDCAISSEDTAASQYLTANGGYLTVNGENLVVIDPTALHLVGETVAFYAQGWDVGDFVVPEGGAVDPGTSISGEFQIGLNFECEMMPWPVEVIESPRIGTLTARVLQAVVSVQNTLGYEVRCNGTTRTVGAYQVGDDLSVPPVPRTDIRRFAVFGNRDHPEIVVAKRRPGPFRVLAIGQRVQA